MTASLVPAISPPSVQPLLAGRRRILVTGGAGFIGGAVVRRLLKDSDALVFNLDKCGYASNLTSVEQLPAERQAAFRFHHISTDEVFGSLGAMGRFSETTPYDPRSPYSASKAASDHLVNAWHHSHGLLGVILKAAAGEPIPLFGDGLNVRDWLTVDDHVDALLPSGAPPRPPDDVGDGPPRPRPARRHRSQQDQQRVGLAAAPQLRGGPLGVLAGAGAN